MGKNKGKIENLTPFSKDNQPTSQAKSAGWSRRKKAQKMMDLIEKYTEMPYKDFAAFLEKIKKNTNKYTVEEVFLANYVAKMTRSDKMMLDYLDRHVPKAPQDIKFENIGDPLTKIIIEVIDSNNGTQNESDKRLQEDDGSESTI